jgi:hypothetical protein
MNGERYASKLECPECGSRNALPIMYGMPGDEMVEASVAGKVALGGCMVSAESPEWCCG